MLNLFVVPIDKAISNVAFCLHHVMDKKCPLTFFSQFFHSTIFPKFLVNALHRHRSFQFRWGYGGAVNFPLPVSSMVKPWRRPKGEIP